MIEHQRLRYGPIDIMIEAPLHDVRGERVVVGDRPPSDAQPGLYRAFDVADADQATRQALRPEDRVMIVARRFASGAIIGWEAMRGT
jgi:hypothetical protein